MGEVCIICWKIRKLSLEGYSILPGGPHNCTYTSWKPTELGDNQTVRLQGRQAQGAVHVEVYWYLATTFYVVVWWVCCLAAWSCLNRCTRGEGKRPLKPDIQKNEVCTWNYLYRAPLVDLLCCCFLTLYRILINIGVDLTQFWKYELNQF